MRGQWCEMIYHPELDQWMVAISGNLFGLHCGECFTLSIGSIKIPCRIELGSQWYVLANGVRFNLHSWETYKVEI